ncbi:MAG TPA: PepSY-associated TM helix domain-containing protein [Chitinophagaceae bacterium]|nr:PepSY-associated TM helix domain-containing protein [Chitinophagaceae bacterium]
MPVNKKSKFNNVITWLHLWLGLISGIIVFILGITGCLFAFQQELSDVFYKKELFIQQPENHSPTLPLSVLKDSAQKVLGKDNPVTFITAYPNSNRAWEFMCYQQGDDNAFWLNKTIKSYQSVFVNPYDGSVSGQINYLHDFFEIDKGIHISLLLNEKYGEPIVGTATLLFVILLITGFIMWYPKNWKKRNRDTALKIRWKAKWKRLNYDLHNVLGFYVFIIALIIAFTGLTMSFNWFRNLVYVVASASITPPDFKTYNSDTTAHIHAVNAMDKAFEKSKQIYPAATRFGIVVPSSKTDPINVTAYHTKDVYYNDDNLYFDQSNGKLLGKQLYKKQNNGVKILAMNYDIHIGAVGGLAGKIIAFLVSLVCASLPVTGFIIWLGRRKKKPKKAI